MNSKRVLVVLLGSLLLTACSGAAATSDDEDEVAGRGNDSDDKDTDSTNSTNSTNRSKSTTDTSSKKKSSSSKTDSKEDADEGDDDPFDPYEGDEGDNGDDDGDVDDGPGPAPGPVLGPSTTCKTSYYQSGSRTANGEAFNPNGMTAAHRTLPFGTKLRVTNPTTGKSVDIRINDRGPVSTSRCLDLARGAFAAIAPLSAGVITIQMAEIR